MEFPKPLFNPGEVVRWTNDYGVKWHARRILRLEEPDEWGQRYYLEPHEAPWMYVREKNLAHETMTLATLVEEVLPFDGSLNRHCKRFPDYLSEISQVIAARANTRADAV